MMRLSGAALAGLALPQSVRAAEADGQIFAAALQLAPDRYGVGLVTAEGRVIRTLDLPARGHDVVVSPDGTTGLVFARQPGTFALAFDIAGNKAPMLIPSVEGRHYFGHGVFSPDGHWLYVTENDFDAARGVIGVYDVRDGFARVAEYETGGTGPHELILLGDGVTLAVANGGIETHPDYGRAKLNLDTMSPSLAFIDPRDGRLLDSLKLSPDLHQLSIRHLARTGDDQVWFGCQYEGAAADQPQLVGFARPGQDIALVDLPPEALAPLRNYVGSVAATRDGAHVAVSSPEGNRILVLSARDGKPVSAMDLRSGCGLAPLGAGFAATSGLGALVGLDGAVADTQFRFGFDNHLVAL